MLEWLVVADDLTGALDSAGRFARHGWCAAVGWAGAPLQGAEVWALDSESRDLPPTEAARRVREMAAPLIPQARRLYKKVDSTLRGNVGAELAALLEASGAPKAVLAPAFPAQGRITLGGRQYVHGEPLSATPFAGAGGSDAAIPDLLRAQADLTVGVVALEVVRQGAGALAAALQARPERVLVVDAVEEGDLATIAEALAAVGEGWLPAGSAGLACAHQTLTPHRSPRGGDKRWAEGSGGAAPVAGALCGPILFVAGTRHRGLTDQITRLQAEGPVTPVRGALGGLLVRGERVLAERARILGDALLAGGDAILTTEGEPFVAGAGRPVAALLAEVAGRALRQAKPGALVLTGGDVAMAVCRGLGARAIAVMRELEPGIPLGRLIGGVGDGLLVVTKAGGFGDDAVLCRIRSALRARN